MNTATADGGRALYGISKDGHDDQAARDAEQVPRAGQRHDARHGHQHPASCSSSGTSSASYAASNLGYVLAHMFALSGFILLRKDRPNWPRPIKLAAIWTPIAGDPRRLVPDPDDRRLRLVPDRRRRLRRHEGEDHRHRRARVGLLLFFFRRIVQDKEAIALAGGDADDARDRPRRASARRRSSHRVSTREGGGLARPLRLPFASTAGALENRRHPYRPEGGFPSWRATPSTTSSSSRSRSARRR